MLTVLTSRPTISHGRSRFYFRQFLLGWNSQMFLRRNLIDLCAIGVFASISVLGQGLHFLPSANHFSAQAHACDHCHHHGSAATTDSDSTLVHECPICRFLAQAQFQTDFRIELLLRHGCELINDRQPSRIASTLVALHLARAPPLTRQS